MSRRPADRVVLTRRRLGWAATFAVTALVGLTSCGSTVGSSGASPTGKGTTAPVVRQRVQPEVPAEPPGHLGSDGYGSVGIADGVLPNGATVFDERYPGVSNLDPALLTALRRAATQARGEGVIFYVNSGWRSRAYQRQLLDEAVAKYGSRAEAARWVATPSTSPHVSGDAVDLGTDAAIWLLGNGAQYGLCQIYANEPWHYELRPDAADDGCPTMYADPTQDPRMNP